jgi:hypothetical protein
MIYADQIVWTSIWTVHFQYGLSLARYMQGIRLDLDSIALKSPLQIDPLRPIRCRWNHGAGPFTIGAGFEKRSETLDFGCGGSIEGSSRVSSRWTCCFQRWKASGSCAKLGTFQ